MRTHRGVGMKRYRVFVFSVVLFGWMAASVFAIYPRQISFSGYMWNVKKSNGRVGPGPNYFSDSTQNVWVDLSGDRKSTRLNSSHQLISYAVFCLKKKKKK